MNQVIPWVLPGRSQQPSYEEFSNAKTILERIEAREEKRLNLSLLSQPVFRAPLLPCGGHAPRRVIQ